MIERYNLKTLITFILISSLSAMITFSCKQASKKRYDELYWKFHHTIQKVDSGTEELEFDTSGRSIGKEEIDTLLVILEKWGWEHYITEDSVLFIRKYGDDIMNNMRVLDDELYRRMKDTLNRTIYY